MQNCAYVPCICKQHIINLVCKLQPILRLHFSLPIGFLWFILVVCKQQMILDYTDEQPDLCLCWCICLKTHIYLAQLIIVAPCFLYYFMLLVYDKNTKKPNVQKKRIVTDVVEE